MLPKYGKLDKKNFEWIKKNSDDIDFSKGIEELSKEDMDESKIIELLNQRGLQNNKLSYFKKTHLFVVDSHLTNINLLESPLIEKILEIRFHTEAFNEDVDSFREFLNMTFQPGISGINHKIISGELQNKSIKIAEKSIQIVDKLMKYWQLRNKTS